MYRLKGHHRHRFQAEKPNQVRIIVELNFQAGFVVAIMEGNAV